LFIAVIVDAGLRAADHGGLPPWRLIEFPQAQRTALADLFESEMRRRDPVATPEDVARGPSWRRCAPCDARQSK
jgi:hypothetical protein